MIPGQGFLIDGLVRGLGGLLGGGGSDVPDYQRKLPRVERIRAAYNAGDTAALAKLKKQFPGLFKEIAAGKWRHVFPEGSPAIRAPAGSPGMRPFVYRAADFPLRNVGAIIPEVGGVMRKVATGALRVGGPASWAVLGASVLGPGALEVLRENVKIPGGLSSTPPRQAQSKGARPAPARRQLPPAPVPGGARPAPAVGPVGSSPSGQSAAPGNPRPATAGPPKPATVTLPAAKPKWWQTALGALSPLLGLLPKASEGQRARARADVYVNPFAQSPTPSAPGLPQAPLTPSETPSAECKCPGKKPSKPRKARTACRTGRFIERANGLQKYDTRKVQCRPSSVKPS